MKKRKTNGNLGTVFSNWADTARLIVHSKRVRDSRHNLEP